MKSSNEWREYSKSRKKPTDIPANPHGTYADAGWAGLGDWLGTGTVAPHLRQYRSFKKGRAFVRGLKLKSSNEWREYSKSGKRPADIPGNPNKVYAKAGWINMSDWLGTGRVGKGHHRSFKKARAFVRSLGLKSHSEWLEYCKSAKKPNDIPSNPYGVYAVAGWLGWGDWLGTGRVASFLREYRPFKNARAFVRGLNLKSGAEWREYSNSGKKPDDIPANPNQRYADAGWTGWGDWLGTRSRRGGWRAFTKARAFVRGLKLKSSTEWREYSKSGKRPADIPGNPSKVYAKDGWTSMGDWLGTGRVYRTGWRPFEKARAFVRGLGLESSAEWNAYCKAGKKPNDIPGRVDYVYAKGGWAGWGDWLGTGTVTPRLRQYRSFKEARAFVRDLNLKSRPEWRYYCASGRKPNDIPSAPDRIYANDGWAGMGDWLGTGTLATHLRRYQSFKNARAFVRALGLKSQKEWRDYYTSGKKPAGIPANPSRTYAEDGWAGTGDWLGCERSGRRSEARSKKGTGEAHAPADAPP